MTAPAGGERVATKDQALSRVPFANTGPPMVRSKDFGGSLRKLLGRLRPEVRGGLGILALGVASVTLSALGPRILGHATDIIVDGVVSGRGISFRSLDRTLLEVLGLFVSASLFSWLQAFTLAGVVQRTMYRLRADVEDKINRLPLSFIDSTPRGDLLSRVTNDLDNLGQSLQQTLSQFLISILTILAVGAMMLSISPFLALFALTLIPLSITVVRVVTKRSRVRFMAQWRHTGALNAQVEETFTGHSLVKVFGRQREAEERFRRTNDQLYEASFRAQFVVGTVQPAMMFLGNLNYLAIAVVGGIRVASGAITIGDIQAFIQYSRQFTMPLTQMAGMMNILQSGIASAERIFELLEAPEQSADTLAEPTGGAPAAPTPAAPTLGRVEFSHVSFSYRPDRPLIEDLSLVAEPGRTVAIVGPTGAGKTTLVNLIMRFYEIQSGTISIDGVDITALPRRELRSKLGMVLQDTWLFEGTIRDNIAYGKVGATEEEILTAARAAYVDRFVHSLPDGYDTVVDDEGGNLSAGEKQLLTIARAFLADPAILILDEATSSVDTRTEVLVQEAMAALRTRRTSFVIAHRLSTIRDADLILVMDGGRIVEQGSHEELLTKGGAYFTLYDSQFRAPAVEVA